MTADRIPRPARRLGRVRNIEDLRRIAMRRLPAPVRHYLEGGAEDEVTVARNRSAFAAQALVPNQLAGVGAVDLSTTLFGVPVSMPLFLAPTGTSRLFHSSAELAVARAAAKAGVLYGLSTLATCTIEDVAATAPGPRLFQVYMFRDRGLTERLVQRCRTSAYDVLCLTVDVPVSGNRERDLVTGLTIPPHLTLSSLASFALHPRWSLGALFGPGFEIANVRQDPAAALGKPMPPLRYFQSQMHSQLTWDDAAWLARLWDGPFVIKGVQSVADARRAADIGARGVIVSNHGGRQFDGAPATLHSLPAIADAVGDRLDVVLDGGVRRGSDVLKALALGAKGCAIGRPYLYGLAAGGERGVELALQIFRGELQRGMALLGCAGVASVDRSLLG